MLTIRRFQKGDEEILSVMIRRTLREVNYTSPKSELDYLIPHYSPETMVELSETGHTYVLEEDGQIIGSGTILPDGETEAEIVAAAKAAKAYPAAGSDARMGGCMKPVIINSGSGNQGMTASLPVVEYAKELNVGYEKMIRAVALSDLVTIHLKSGIGRLSAYCGAVSAGCGCGAGIAYLYGGGLKEIEHTIVNSIAIDSGMVCDGAKASCAAKIASAVDAGILGYHMYKNGQQFRAGDGLVTKGVEETIRNIGILAREGMRETDREILHIMCD